VLEGRLVVYDKLTYTAFLIPGLVMMSVLQNAFANTSSSLIQSKITGNLVFVLLAPLTHLEFYSAYVLAAVFRGVVVGLGVLLITLFLNFLIMPATMLSGVFYSIHSLPEIWQFISHLNPFFYMIDGFRYGFFGVSDVSPWLSLTIVSVFFLVVSGLALRLLQSGYKLRH
ncbi:MAG: metal-dependent hydrolase, partial [Burkholderiaceae bacterium]|nr:metal-dependent hydrolase [Burkholderiaceae bacterium]